MATYDQPSLVNYNDNPPTNDGSTDVTNNLVDWDRHIDEIGNPLVAYANSINTAVDSAIDTIDDSRPISVLDYGATGLGVADDHDAIMSAFAAGKSVIFPPGTYLVNSTLALTSAQAGLKIYASGATLKKGFNGDFITYSGAYEVEWYGGYFDGVYASYTGGCFVLTGSASYSPKWTNTQTFGFSDADWEFGADAGKRASLVACNALVDLANGQTTADRAVYFNGPDTLAGFRSFANCTFDGTVQVVGALDTSFATTTITKMEIDANTSILSYVGGLWGNAGGALTLNGEHLNLQSIRISAAVTITAGSSGTFVGNIFTSGGLTDSSTPGDWFIAYKEPAAVDYTFGKNLLYITESVASRIQTSRISSPGDADATYTPGASSPVFRFASVLTATRTVTLGTTNATNGTRLRVVRASTATGAFNINVGALKNLTVVDEWCDVEYNGSAWVLTAYGTL